MTTIIKPKSDNLIWIDLEMTGLNPEHDRVIEIATIVTDSDLNILAEGPVFAINQPEELLNSMDSWNTKQHGKTGLLERVLSSTVDEDHAQAETIEFLMHHVPPQKSPMCGNTICQDRRFLYRYMPKLVQYFHYRNLDVTTLKMLAQRWAPDVAKGAKKESVHRAIDDIRDSIDELRYYRKHLLRLESED